MLIAIPTIGRVSAQVTLRNLLDAGVGVNNPRHEVALVTVPEEAEEYFAAWGTEMWTTPAKVRGISATREWIINELPLCAGHRYVCMLDDDMDFCRRPQMDAPKLETIRGVEIVKMLDLLEGWLKRGFVHAGLSARQGNNHETEEFKDATRMMNAYAYDTVVLREMQRRGAIKMGRVKVMEDFDLTLQLLRLGYANRVSYRYCWNQRGSGKEGGCSTYRTAEVQREAAERLAELHPDFVKVVTKKSKSGWEGMEERTDVTIQWKRAYEEGRQLLAKQEAQQSSGRVKKSRAAGRAIQGA